MPTFEAANCIAAAITIGMLIINALLLYLTFRIQNKTRDIKLIITIGIIELIAPVLGFSDVIISLITGEDATSNMTLCQSFGFFSMMIFYFQIIINSIIAMERLKIITKVNLLRYLFLPIAFLSVCYLILALFSASNYYLRPNYANILCILDPTISIVSAIAYYLFTLTTLSGTLIIIYCYRRLALYTSNLPDFINLNNDILEANKNKPIYRGATLRIYSILILYFVCMFSGIILLLLESSLNFINYQYTQLIYTFSAISINLILSGILLNSIIILLSHTKINYQFKLLLKSFIGDDGIPDSYN